MMNSTIQAKEQLRLFVQPVSKQRRIRREPEGSKKHPAFEAFDVSGLLHSVVFLEKGRRGQSLKEAQGFLNIVLPTLAYVTNHTTYPKLRLNNI